jgi:hypothetical protein
MDFCIFAVFELDKVDTSVKRCTFAGFYGLVRAGIR